MTKVIVSGFSLSVDGYGAGPNQSLEDPLGERGEELHTWMVETAMFHEMLGKDSGSQGIDNDYATRAMEGFGAFILGRNMFGPVRGDWPDDAWKGWWGDNPPYHAPTFVLTHYPRDPVVMEGGTVFHFVTDGIEAALEQAREAAAGRNVKIGGGVSTVRQYLRAGLIDEIHLAISPVVLGQGEALFAGLGGSGLNLAAADTVIHYDPWWNPAVEDQATDRAHRIGQTKPVFVYKLRTLGTVEERIAELQTRKRGLTDALFENGKNKAGALDAGDIATLFAPIDG